MCFIMVKKRVQKKKVRTPVDPISSIHNFDKNLSKAMKKMDASINISLSTTLPGKRKVTKKKRKKK